MAVADAVDLSGREPLMTILGPVVSALTRSGTRYQLRLMKGFWSGMMSILLCAIGTTHHQQEDHENLGDPTVAMQEYILAATCSLVLTCSPS
jgi:hypothetical protein